MLTLRNRDFEVIYDYATIWDATMSGKVDDGRLVSMTLTPNCHLLKPRRKKYISRFVEKNKLSVNAVNIGIEL